MGISTKKSKSTTGRKRITFKFKANPGSTVTVAGNFNDWDSDSKVLKDKGSTGDYEVTMLLPKGVYEYKFCVDDKWCVDPENPNFITNAHGTLNSVIEVN
ncbi:MAG: glycogen-binding domain-containing protein [Sedimentisphaeraceae bacterium JB056]